MKIMGSVADYVNQMKLLHKAKEKINKPFGTVHTAPATQAEKAAEAQAVSERLMKIQGKLKAGKKLSGSDMDFLRKHAPDLYDKAVKIAKEREEHKEKLARCKSKEEARNLHAQKTSTLLAEAESISTSPMDKGAKLAAMEFIGMRAAALQQEYAEFVGSVEYRVLPDTVKEAEDEEKARRREGRDVEKSREGEEDLYEKQMDYGKTPPKWPDEKGGLPGGSAADPGQETEKAGAPEHPDLPDGTARGAAHASVPKAGASIPRASAPRQTQRAISAYRQVAEIT